MRNVAVSKRQECCSFGSVPEDRETRHGVDILTPKTNRSPPMSPTPTRADVADDINKDLDYSKAESGEVEETLLEMI